MVDVTGLKRPFTRKFGGKTFEINSRAQNKATANKIAESLRNRGRLVRTVKVKKGMKYAIYVGH